MEQVRKMQDGETEIIFGVGFFQDWTVLKTPTFLRKIYKKNMSWKELNEISQQSCDKS